MEFSFFTGYITEVALGTFFIEIWHTLRTIDCFSIKYGFN